LVSSIRSTTSNTYLEGNLIINRTRPDIRRSNVCNTKYCCCIFDLSKAIDLNYVIRISCVSTLTIKSNLSTSRNSIGNIYSSVIIARPRFTNPGRCRGSSILPPVTIGGVIWVTTLVILLLVLLPFSKVVTQITPPIVTGGNIELPLHLPGLVNLGLAMITLL
jgi:hypothetical protein